MNPEPAITTTGELEALLTAQPELVYDGFKWMPTGRVDPSFAPSRQRLREAIAEIDLCRRLLRDPPFRDQIFRGRFRTGRFRRRRVVTSCESLMRLAKWWDFRAGRVVYGGEGRQVGEGAATAAALLEGMPVTRCFGVAAHGEVTLLAPNGTHANACSTASPRRATLAV
jgi:hypothetical protein